jgi:diguanylate cyclase (GGDEF)-like protein
VIFIINERTENQNPQVGRKKNNTAHDKHIDAVMLFYRWLIFLFSVILCFTGIRYEAYGYAIIESLAVAAIYNGAVTAYILIGRKRAYTIQYLDITVIMLLVMFSGGIRSELFIFTFFIIGFCGINNDVANTMKTGIVCAILYTGTCIFADRLYMAGINYATLVIRDFLYLMAAFSISRVCYEVKRYDDMRKKEFRLARTDKLTGLANRHYFDQKLKEEVDYAVNRGSVLNILMFDMDNFKNFNDTFGHVSGDKLLVLFSDIIRQCVRKSDIPVRYGGEEFMIIIRDLDIFIAKSVGDRIRRQLEKQRIYLGQQEEKAKVTVSCGIAQFPTHSTNIKDVIERADQALYYAKEIGKNIIVCYDEIGKSRDTLSGAPFKL